MALLLCLCLAPGAQGRGLLGLFADDKAPPPVPAVAAPKSALPRAEPRRPVAWISALRGVADPAAVLYGYVDAGTRIDLGADGEITFTWLSPCREDSVTGGVATVTAAGVQVSGAPAPHSRALSCQPLERVLPGEAAAPGPVAVNAAEPLFAWPARPGRARLSVMDAGAGAPIEVWSGDFHGGAAPYPHEAAPLVERRPYLVRATFEDGAIYEASFSVDPDLRYSNAPINALVMLRAAAAP